MAVPEQTPYVEYEGNGVTTSFALEFDCKDKEHLIVLVDNIEPNLGTWSLVNGSVVFGIAPANGKIIAIQRNTPFRRDTNFQSYDNSLRPATINKDFDWVWYKLQELGVADWILGNRIDALKNYVDRKDDELKAYLMEEIRKQGVALDQLDDYYNYLMQRLAQIAVDKGWDASFVTYSGVTQERINDGLESIADMLAIENPKDGMRVFVKQRESSYIFNRSLISESNGITNVSGWIIQYSSHSLNCVNAGFKADGSDETILAQQCLSLGLSIEIPKDYIIGIDVDSGLWTQWAWGLGQIKWLNYTATTNMERVVNANVPVHPVSTSTFQQQQNADVRGGLGGRNVGKRFECNPTKTDNYTFNNMQTLIEYGGADIVADMVAITDREVKQYSGVVYTATTAQHNSFKTDDIQTGDYIRAGSNILGVVLSVDKSSGLITLIDGWGNTDSKELNVTPTSGAICYTPIAYRMWGRNDYVTARANNSEIYNIIGYELDVIAGHDLQDACGFFPVAFGTDTCVAAFRTGRGTRNWWYGLQILDNSANAGVWVGKGVTYGIQHGAKHTEGSITVYSSQTLYGMKVDSASGAALRSDNTAVVVDVNNADTGVKFNSGGASSSVIRNYVDNFLIKSDVFGKGSFSMTALGKTNRNIKAYTSISENLTLTRDNTNSIAIISSSAVTSVQLSTSFEDGEILELYSNQAQNVNVGGLVTLSPSKKYAKLIYKNSGWVQLI